MYTSATTFNTVLQLTCFTQQYKSIKSVFILVQCNTSLSKNYVANSITVVCMIDGLNLRGKKDLSTFSVHMKSVVEQGFFNEFAFDTKRLKHSSILNQVKNVRHSNVVEFEFELCHISRDL